MTALQVTGGPRRALCDNINDNGNQFWRPPYCVTILDGELFAVQEADRSRIDVYALDTFDRRRCSLSFGDGAIRTIRTTKRIIDLFSLQGRLFMVTYDNSDPDAVYKIIIDVDARHDGQAPTVVARIKLFDDHIVSLPGFLLATGDMSVYSQRRNGALLVAESLESAFIGVNLSSGRLPASLPREGIARDVAFVSVYPLGDGPLVFKDADGCVLLLDESRRLRVYGPELRLERDFGRLPSISPDMYGLRLLVDEVRRLLYLYDGADRRVDVGEGRPFFWVFAFCS